MKASLVFPSDDEVFPIEDPFWPIPYLLGVGNPSGFSFGGSAVYKVCLYENPPLVGLDADGRPSGLFVELLEAVAHAEGWQLQYREASWAQCLEELRSGAADILPVIAYSEERSRAFLFSSETGSTARPTATASRW